MKVTLTIPLDLPVEFEAARDQFGLDSVERVAKRAIHEHVRMALSMYDTTRRQIESAIRFPNDGRDGAQIIADAGLNDMGK